nr:hypothetical protein [uncultured Olsenella sp.]
MPRRRNSWGSVTRVAKGRYRLRYWGTDATGTYRRMSETVDGTRRDAEGVLARRRVEHDSEHATPTVGQAYETWWVPWAERRVTDGRMARSSLVQFESAWRNHVAPRWADAQLDSVRPAQVQAWLLSLTRSQAMHSKTVLARVFERARFNEATANDPLGVALELPPEARRESSMASFDADALLAAWDALRGTPTEAAYVLMAFGGLRVGEALGVRCSEVTLGECDGVPVATVRVRRTAGDRDGHMGPDGALKTRQSVRVAVIAGSPAERLAEIATGRLRNGMEWLSGDGPAPGKGRARHAFGAALRSSGLPRMSFQSLRPSWQTVARHRLLLDQSVIESLMGHAMPGVTGRHYERPRPAQLVEAMAAAYARTPVWEHRDD